MTILSHYWRRVNFGAALAGIDANTVFILQGVSTVDADGQAGVGAFPNSGTALSIDTVVKPFGDGSINFTSASSLIYLAFDTEFPSAESWTFEGFAYISTPASSSIAHVLTPSAGGTLTATISGSALGIQWFNDADGVIDTNSWGSLTENTWYHWALQRDRVSGKVSAWYNGSRIFAFADTSTDLVPTDLTITSSGATATGHIASVRISDTARYDDSSATYTIPDEPLT